MSAFAFAVMGVAASIACRAESARELITGSGVAGGLIVHVGCGDGSLTASLRVDDRYLVYGLDDDPGLVEKARVRIRSMGRYGVISVGTYDGSHLPLVDNLVNLLIVEDAAKVSKSEMLRVVCPRGVVMVRDGDAWSRTVKPWPPGIDEWTHCLYDASGNAVSKDVVVGPPERLQWAGGPRWTRHHEAVSSFQAMVTARGRIFYIIDEGPRVSLFLPSMWRLVSRDAFNGKILWKRDIEKWTSRLYGYKSGPMQMSRRLVAVDDRVYASLGIGAPVSVLDAATGRTLRTLDHTGGCEELIFFEGVLFVMSGEVNSTYSKGHRFSAGNAWKGERKRLTALDPRSGKRLWEIDTPIAPLSYAASGKGLFLHDGKDMVCLDRSNGRAKWRTPVVLDNTIPTSNTPTLVAYDDVVLFMGGKDDAHRSGGWYAMRNLRTLTALSADTGKRLWSSRAPPTGFECPKDVLVIDGIAWTGAILLGKHPGGRAKEGDGVSDGAFTGRDIHTGKVVHRHTPPWDIYWFHQRCYRSRATQRFILPSRTGIEFVSPSKGWVSFNHWTRGACLFGVVPANGLLYQTPHPCGCYVEALLHGFYAMAAGPPAPTRARAPAGAQALAKGPAYGLKPRALEPVGKTWPSYRHDPARSARTEDAARPGLSIAWTHEAGARLTPPTVADGKVFVADLDSNTLLAVDALSGERVWHYTAGGRIDSPPTIWRGRVFFGCGDGNVYCLVSGSGQLAWRHRASPDERLLVSHERIESAWPVHGSVLVHKDRLYCIAGRSMFLDGGLRFLILDPVTGRKLGERVLDDTDPTTDRNIQYKMSGLSLPATTADILSAQGDSIYMKSQQFDAEGGRAEVRVEPRRADARRSHIFSPSGFLDDTGFHRTYMVYGTWSRGGFQGIHTAPRSQPSGRVLAFDDTHVYGFSRLPHLHRWTRSLEFHVYAALRNPGRGGKRVACRKVGRQNKFSLDKSALRYVWSHYDPPLYVSAMTLVGETLVLAGPPAIRNDKSQDALGRWQGKRGGMLVTMSASGGELLDRRELPSPPVFDGMAWAYGRAYLSLKNGRVACLASGRPATPQR
jgi:outer membrane protein assembly factor BamB